MKKHLFFLLGTLLFFSVNAQAQFYVGASGGNSFINQNLNDINGNSFKVDDNTGSWKVYGGLGNKFLGIEGGYRSVGTASTVANDVPYETSITGWDVAAKGTIHIGPVFGFAKAGAFFGQYDNRYPEISSLEKDTSFMWGLGAGVLLGDTFEIRMEWESLNLQGSNNISTLSLGTAIHFGGGKN
ncbi:outer membrane beta-barrel protein [Flammeovirga sp. SJP92]|uniref:outer membrane beta-barrel protein n=1 Tax=Flammeovirga sp. SJP92 TaxID=1775430 RepID=UPI000786D310|nr:outer membrane beta-barrel protein [Flammeovirga sp. SJP92]KXX68891.1 hypothetical protein AVL50_17170 [Flammeovirga sp. SJP92]